MLIYSQTNFKIVSTGVGQKQVQDLFFDWNSCIEMCYIPYNQPFIPHKKKKIRTQSKTTHFKLNLNENPFQLL